MHSSTATPPHAQLAPAAERVTAADVARDAILDIDYDDEPDPEAVAGIKRLLEQEASKQ